jgi:hypothetical protein
MKMRTDPRGLIQDPRRDTAALLSLIGFIAFFAVAFLVGRACELPTAYALPPLAIAPALLVAPIFIRSERARSAVGAVVLFVVLFVFQIASALFVSLYHCGLELGLGV